MTLSLVRKPFVIACCKVFGILAKNVTGPLWRIIESTKHVLDLSEDYHTLFLYYNKMSNIATAFISVEDLQFCAEVVGKDEVYEMLLKQIKTLIA